MQNRKFITLTIATTVFLSPLSVFGKQPKLTSYQNQMADENIKNLESSEPSEDDQAKNLLEMKISTPKAIYKVGEPIVVNISLKNISDDTELYTTRGGCNFSNNGVGILNSKHKKVPYIRSQFAINLFCSGRGLLSLKPHGDTLDEPLRITKLFMINHPDIYTVRMWNSTFRREVNGGGYFGVKSNSLEVQVISK
jgi:hypothetical protein